MSSHMLGVPFARMIRLLTWRGLDEGSVQEIISNRMGLHGDPARTGALVIAVRKDAQVGPTLRVVGGKAKKKTKKSPSPWEDTRPTSKLPPEDYARRFNLNQDPSKEDARISRIMRHWDHPVLREIVMSLGLAGAGLSQIAAALQKEEIHLSAAHLEELVWFVWDLRSYSQAERVMAAEAFLQESPAAMTAARYGQALWAFETHRAFLDLKDLDIAAMARDLAYAEMTRMRDRSIPFDAASLKALYGVAVDAHERVKASLRAESGEADEAEVGIRTQEAFAQHSDVLLRAEIAGCAELVREGFRVGVINEEVRDELLQRFRKGIALNMEQQETFREAIASAKRAVEPEKEAYVFTGRGPSPGRVETATLDIEEVTEESYESLFNGNGGN